jgi:hypothetical protein
MERDGGKFAVTREITQVKIVRPDDVIYVVITVMMMMMMMMMTTTTTTMKVICLLPNHFLFIIYPSQFTLHNLSNMNTNYHLPFNILSLDFRIQLMQGSIDQMSHDRRFTALWS